jgi:hypothetical protein
MRCFLHAGADAVGICKSCQRGLCADCAVEVGTTLACRGRCEADVSDINRMTAWSVKMVDSTANGLTSVADGLTSVGRTVKAASIFNLVTGAAFAAWGALAEPRMWFLIVIGVCFLAFGLFDLMRRAENSSRKGNGAGGS